MLCRLLFLFFRVVLGLMVRISSLFIKGCLTWIRPMFQNAEQRGSVTSDTILLTSSLTLTLTPHSDTYNPRLRLFHINTLSLTWLDYNGIIASNSHHPPVT